MLHHYRNVRRHDPDVASHALPSHADAIRFTLKELFMKTRVLALVLAAAFVAVPTSAQEKLKFKVVGQPLATGLIQKTKEQPFFETLAQKTGLPIEFDYKSIDTLGVKDTEQLRMMKS